MDIDLLNEVQTGKLGYSNCMLIVVGFECLARRFGVNNNADLYFE